MPPIDDDRMSRTVGGTQELGASGDDVVGAAVVQAKALIEDLQRSISEVETFFAPKPPASPFAASLSLSSGILELADQLAAGSSNDVINPEHYKSHPSGVECIDIAEHFDFCTGNAIKYLWRAGQKGDALQDLEKAAWYLTRRIANLKAERCAAGRP